MAYLRAVERAGGLPVVLPPLELDRISPLLDRLSGVLLSGGPDLDPAAYGRAAHPELGRTEPQLDVFEVQLAREADARGLPILGICRGAQALNIARGGHPAPAPPRDHGRLDRAPPEPAGRPGHARGPHRARQRSRDPGGLRADGRQLLPPPVRRAAGRRPACGRLGAGRRHRGDRRAGGVPCCWAFSGTPRHWSMTPLSSPSSGTW